MRKNGTPVPEIGRETYDNMPELLDKMVELMRAGQFTLHLDIEPGDATNYSLFIAVSQEGYYVINEHNGAVVHGYDGDISPNALDMWCQDVGCARWNPCTLYVVAQILAVLDGEPDAKWYDWEAARPCER